MKAGRVVGDAVANAPEIFEAGFVRSHARVDGPALDDHVADHVEFSLGILRADADVPVLDEDVAVGDVVGNVVPIDLVVDVADDGKSQLRPTSQDEVELFFHMITGDK